MPVVSIFFGIVVRLLYREHGVAHFHAESKASRRHSPSTGRFSQVPIQARTALRLIKEWATTHHADLEANWGRLKAGAPLERIAPLE